MHRVRRLVCALALSAAASLIVSAAEPASQDSHAEESVRRVNAEEVRVLQRIMHLPLEAADDRSNGLALEGEVFKLELHFGGRLYSSV